MTSEEVPAVFLVVVFVLKCTVERAEVVGRGFKTVGNCRACRAVSLLVGLNWHFDDESGDFGGQCDGKRRRDENRNVLTVVMKKCSPARGIRNCDRDKEVCCSAGRCSIRVCLSLKAWDRRLKPPSPLMMYSGI